MATLVENRSPAWEPRELEELLQGIQEHYEVLFGKWSANLSKTDKDWTWSEIVQTRPIMKDGKRRHFMESSGEAAIPQKLHLAVMEKLLSLVPKLRLVSVPGGGVDTGPLKRPMHENGKLSRSEGIDS
ncbi:hypothetical protein DPMN_122283 [Dreissena polymorpha]|uniref:Myb/SANT-like DNA-binding domain-containing protein n=1 Tax=Dreissena polymorpha TaxID=45954 RepID=A0A9D4GNR0_DREPO|nr:hypothetical protein DPMN_122283 [Dreissena polymorpha]